MGLIVTDDATTPNARQATWLDDEDKAAALDAHLDSLAPRYAAAQTTAPAPAQRRTDPFDAETDKPRESWNERIGVAQASLAGLSIFIAGELYPRALRLVLDLLQAAA